MRFSGRHSRSAAGSSQFAFVGPYGPTAVGGTVLGGGVVGGGGVEGRGFAWHRGTNRDPQLSSAK